MAMCFSNSTIIKASSDSNCDAKISERYRWLEVSLKQTLDALSLKLGQPFDDIRNSFHSQMESYRIGGKFTSTTDNDADESMCVLT